MSIEKYLKALPVHIPVKMRLATIIKTQELQTQEFIRVVESIPYNTSETYGIKNYRHTSKLIKIQDEK